MSRARERAARAHLGYTTGAPLALSHTPKDQILIIFNYAQWSMQTGMSGGGALARARCNADRQYLFCQTLNN